MGYRTQLYIVNVKIKDECRSVVSRQLRNHKRAPKKLHFFLDWAMIDSQGSLCFRSGVEDVCASEEGIGSVPSKDSKWYEIELIVEWLKQYCEGGRIVLHSLEDDGGAFGWEFNGKGKARALDLKPVGQWT